MRILNLYAGIGGNRKLWGDDHQITAVEYNQEIADVYKANFPNDIVIVGDAHQYLLDHYKEPDFVWGSPPCPKHSKMMKATRHDVVDYFDARLYQEIILLEHFFKGRYCVENVVPYYKPLIKPTVKIGRHLFWSNFEIFDIESKTVKGFINKTDSPEAIQMLKDKLGIYYEKNIYINGNHSPGQVLRNAVDPKIGLHILNESQRNGLF